MSLAPPRPDVAGALRRAEALSSRLPAGLRYHDARHTFGEVLPAARRLASDLGLDADERELIATAVAFHDLGFLEQRERHELASAELARRVLPALGYAPDEVARIAAMILATALPQRPLSAAERIVADADLSVLAASDFLERNEDLRLELTAAGRGVPRPAWLRQQRRFLLTHRYHTPAAERRYGPGRRRNLALLQARLRRLEAARTPRATWRPRHAPC